MKVLALYGSPRKEGNTTLLLQELVKGRIELGASVTEISLCDLQILPCVADYSCAQSGECFLQDDMQDIYSHMTDHDCIVLAAPIFFYSVNAQTKALIDRSQALWARKYMLKKPISAKGIKRGAFLYQSEQPKEQNYLMAPCSPSSIFLTLWMRNSPSAFSTRASTTRGTF